jgi:uncharacterized protein (DUF1800 family)
VTERSDVAHLLRRTGFGVTAAELDAAAAAGYAATVERVLAPPATDPGVQATPPPAFAEPAPLGKNAGKQERAARNRTIRRQLDELTLWWLDRMTRAAQPSTERLTLFWHGHWATSGQKVRSARMMLAQNETLRRLARGDFREMARAMVRDPALLIWLDGQKNKKSSPNENLARELMELFTLGRGAYTEEDVRQAARALTGWRVDRAAGRAELVPRQHAEGPKTVLGHTADLDDRGLVDLLVAQPASARFVATRLWLRLAAPQPPPAATLSRLVAGYGPNRDLRGLLRALLTDPAFRGPAARQALVKTPVEYAVGLLRALRLPVDRDGGTASKQLAGSLQALGQVPFYPPNVGGWPGGVAWLSTAATQARIQLAQRAARAADLSAIAAAPQRDRPDAVARLLCVDAWTPRTRSVLADAAADPVRLVTLALVAPEYVVC